MQTPISGSKSEQHKWPSVWVCYLDMMVTVGMQNRGGFCGEGIDGKDAGRPWHARSRLAIWLVPALAMQKQ